MAAMEKVRVAFNSFHKSLHVYQLVSESHLVHLYTDMELSLWLHASSVTLEQLMHAF